jgi:hypothetical protein
VERAYKLINSVWNKEELPDQWKESIIVPFRKKVTKLTVIIIIDITAINSIQHFVEYPLSRLSPYVDEIIGDHQCGL